MKKKAEINIHESYVNAVAPLNLKTTDLQEAISNHKLLWSTARYAYKSEDYSTAIYLIVESCINIFKTSELRDELFAQCDYYLQKALSSNFMKEQNDGNIVLSNGKVAYKLREGVVTFSVATLDNSDMINLDVESSMELGMLEFVSTRCVLLLQGILFDS